MSISAVKDIGCELSEHELGLRETVDEAAKDAREAFEAYREIKVSMRKKNNRQYPGPVF
ncbi:MAG: hypothetical protein Q8O22_02310 [Candidatus Omnitrophota bacterium]|nr:hypothetical protein [Candidatus Omnitrophota bacterium]